MCAASTVQGYMKKFGQDCNSDGKNSYKLKKRNLLKKLTIGQINCYDYARIHKYGGYGGCQSTLQGEFKNKFDTCINYALQQQG